MSDDRSLIIILWVQLSQDWTLGETESERTILLQSSRFWLNKLVEEGIGNDQSGGKSAFFASIDSHSAEFNLKWRRKLAFFLASIYEMGDQKSNRAGAGKSFCPKERRQWGELIQNEKTFRLLRLKRGDLSNDEGLGPWMVSGLTNFDFSSFIWPEGKTESSHTSSGSARWCTLEFPILGGFGLEIQSIRSFKEGKTHFFDVKFLLWKCTFTRPFSTWAKSKTWNNKIFWITKSSQGFSNQLWTIIGCWLHRWRIAPRCPTSYPSFARIRISFILSETESTMPIRRWRQIRTRIV